MQKRAAAVVDRSVAGSGRFFGIKPMEQLSSPKWI